MSHPLSAVHRRAKNERELAAMADTTELLDTKYDTPLDAWKIVNGKGEVLAVTKLGPAVITNEGRGQTQSDRLRWVIETGQVLPDEQWRRETYPDPRKHARVQPLGNGDWLNA